MASYAVTGETVGKPTNSAIRIPAPMAQEASLHSFSEIPTTYWAVPVLPEIQVSWADSGCDMSIQAVRREHRWAPLHNKTKAFVLKRHRQVGNTLPPTSSGA